MGFICGFGIQQLSVVQAKNNWKKDSEINHLHGHSSFLVVAAELQLIRKPRTAAVCWVRCTRSALYTHFPMVQVAALPVLLRPNYGDQADYVHIDGLGWLPGVTYAHQHLTSQTVGMHSNSLHHSQLVFTQKSHITASWYTDRHPLVRLVGLASRCFLFFSLQYQRVLVFLSMALEPCHTFFTATLATARVLALLSMRERSVVS